MENKRVAIIGGGPCGLAVLSAFHEEQSKGNIIPEIVCYEKQSKVSGLWNLTWRTGVDEHGEPVHGSMYRYLWSNGPKECLEIANYTFDEHFKKPIPSFPPRIVLQDYILSRFEKCKQEKCVKLNTVVRNVIEKEGKFVVTYEDLTTNKRNDSTFDYVIVATGHYSIPSVPYYRGLETYSGRVLHSHDFRNAEEFKDKTVLLVGSSYSAEDIALQCCKYGAKQCIISYRSSKLGYKWPDNIIEVPQIEKIDKNSVYFIDGSVHKADAIIFCTGYKHHFPFMEDKLRLRNAKNIVYPNHLYKGIVLKENKNLIYLGQQDQYYTFTMFDIQAWYARDIILGKIEIPDQETVNAYIKNWHEKCLRLKSSSEEINFQRDYLADLLKEIDYCSLESNSKIADMFHQWKYDKAENIMTYRDKCFASPYTATVAVPLAKDWFDCLDDSKECFMNGCKD